MINVVDDLSPVAYQKESIGGREDGQKYKLGICASRKCYFSDNTALLV
jgi:hypothetical protein